MQPARKRGWFVERRLMALATGFESVRIARAPNFISGITDMHFASTFSVALWYLLSSADPVHARPT